MPPSRIRNRHLEAKATLPAEPIYGDITLLPTNPPATPLALAGKINEIIASLNLLRRAYIAESVVSKVEDE